MDTDGKREHEIALVSEEVLVEALDHQNGGEDHHAKTRQHIDNGEQDADNKMCIRDRYTLFSRPGAPCSAGTERGTRIYQRKP